jgi:CHAT domain-containing protein
MFLSILTRFLLPRIWCRRLGSLFVISAIASAIGVDAQENTMVSGLRNGAEFIRVVQRWQKADDPEEQIAALEIALKLEPKLKQWPLKDPREQIKAMLRSGLGDSYLNRRSGDRGNNLDRAIESYKAVLTASTREHFPQQWARTQNNLGNAHAARAGAKRADSLELAIEAYEAALTFYARETFPNEWAITQYNLASVYQNRIYGEPADNVELAIKAYEGILTVRTRDAFPRQWAQTQHDLGKAYVDRIHGERADNLELAFKAYEEALTVLTRENFPNDWASLQQSLGIAFTDRIRGERAENLERAINAHEAALSIYTRETSSQDWASERNNLGTTYAERIRGDRAENLELAIAAYKDALSVRTYQALPEEWAMTQSNLAVTYPDRIQGDRSDNLEQAIKASEAALSVYMRETAPLDWARTQNGLGRAYADRIRGERAENLEQAIKAYEAALSVYTRETLPRQWAAELNNRASAYRSRIRGNRADNLEQSINSYREALSVYSREAFPYEWGTTQNNLGNTYANRILGDHEENLEQAIKSFRMALTVRDRNAFPQDWAQTQTNLANVYAVRIRGENANNVEQAIEAYKAALTVYTRYAFPRDHLRTAGGLAQSLLRKRDWVSASEVYRSAREAFLLQFGQGLDDAEARDLIEDAGPMFAEAAYATVELGDVDGALSLLSEGKARLMAVALRQLMLDLPPEKQARHAALKAEIRKQSRVVEKAPAVEGAQAIDHLSELRRELGTLVQEGLAARSVADGPMWLARSVLPEGGAIVAPIITNIGTKIVIMATSDRGSTITALDLPDFTSDRLEKLLRGDGDDRKVGGWFGAYNIQYLPSQQQRSRIAEWRDAIDGIGPTLWTLFAGQLDTELQRFGVKPGGRLVWLPAGALGLLPLSLAREPVSGRQFIDAYEVSYAPSLEALGSASRQLTQSRQISLAAAMNPTGNIPKLNLPFAEIEGALVASHFAGKPLVLLGKSDATPRDVLAALKGKTYWHFSSHGFFDWNDVRNAGLRMKDGEPLTIGSLLDAEDSLGRPRLVVLSACETGLYDVSRNPDEFVGLPATFMQLGAAGVVSALWQVDDLATALLMAKFYDLHMDEKLAPAAALREAQLWLRGASKAELISFGRAVAAKAKLDPSKLLDLEASLKSRRRSGARSSLWNMLQNVTANVRRPFQSHPFANPYYWGGFVYSGL